MSHLLTPFSHLAAAFPAESRPMVQRLPLQPPTSRREAAGYAGRRSRKKKGLRPGTLRRRIRLCDVAAHKSGTLECVLCLPCFDRRR